MIKTLKIKNIALIDEVKIEFGEGFNILTGETGAGKSIIIDSLNFLLGAKADKSLIKEGTDIAFVEGAFEIDETNNDLLNLFSEFDLELENVVKLSRKMTRDNKNECRINNEIFTLSSYKKLTALLVDIFGQHDNFILLDNKNHLMFLDSYCGKSLTKPKEMLSDSIKSLKDIDKSLKDLGGIGENREKEIEFINFEINQIEEANLKVGEDDELADRKKLILNSEKIFDAIKEANDNLQYNVSLENYIKSAINGLNSVKNIDEDLNSFVERLQNLRYEIIDICDDLKDKEKSLDFSEDELNRIEERLDFIRDLKRKFGNSIEEIFEYLEKSKARLSKLENAEVELNKLIIERNTCLKEIYNECVEIQKIRKEKAKLFETAILAELKDLGMKSASFKIDFKNELSLENIEKFVSSNGADEIEFLFSANLGEPVKPMQKIISGGELSRFSLALKCVVNNMDSFKTFVFDEIDTGIGGAVGSVVAKKISKISKHNQVLCITHLAQIASFADNHYKVVKFEKDNKTFTSMQLLDKDERVAEITRMIGIMDNADYAKLHATKLIEESENFKKVLS